jgi:mRNA interferase RelE/StbE
VAKEAAAVLKPKYHYGLAFYNAKAKKEFFSFPESVRKQLDAKLNERRNNPVVLKDKLSGYKDVYKIKIKKPAVRLCYKIENRKMVLIIVITGSRSDVYEKLRDRIGS